MPHRRRRGDRIRRVTTTATAGGKFVFANSSAYDTLDPHAVFDVGRVASRINLYDGLMRWFDNPPHLEPWLAEKVDISEDGLTYAFTLRDAKFHDGSPVEASDVVYSIDRILEMKKGACSLFEATVAPGSTKAPDAKTVVFTLSKPSAIFLAPVPEIHVVNAEVVKANEADGDLGTAWLSKNDAGSGSFQLKRYDPAIGRQATRFEDHFFGWDMVENPLDEIEFRTVVEINSRVLGVMNGDFHGTDGYLPQDQVKRLRTSEHVVVMEEESVGIFYSIIHNGRAPMNPYTRSLLSAIPQIGQRRITDTFWLEGEPPDPGNLPSGCRFRTRCPLAQPQCAAGIPPLNEHLPGHADACLFSDRAVSGP